MSLSQRHYSPRVTFLVLCCGLILRGEDACGYSSENLNRWLGGVNVEPEHNLQDFKLVFVVQSVVAGRTGARMKTPIKSSSLRCKLECPTCNGASKDSTYKCNQTTCESSDVFEVLDYLRAEPVATDSHINSTDDVLTVLFAPLNSTLTQ